MSGEEMGEEIIVLTAFWAAFIIDILVVAYAYKLSKRMGGSGLLHKTTVLAGFSAFVFGLHHIMEIFLVDMDGGIAIAESVEGIAAILLGMAVYQLYKLVGGK